MAAFSMAAFCISKPRVAPAQRGLALALALGACSYVATPLLVIAVTYRRLLRTQRRRLGLCLCKTTARAIAESEVR